MNVQPVRKIGERIYEYVAANRDRYFVCNYEGSEQP